MLDKLKKIKKNIYMMIEKTEDMEKKEENEIEKPSTKSKEDEKTDYKKGRDFDFKLEELDSKNIVDILSGILFELRNTKDTEEKEDKIEKFLDKWHGDSNWLRETRDDTQVQKIVEDIEKLFTKSKEDKQTMLLNRHLWKDEEIISDDTFTFIDEDETNLKDIYISIFIKIINESKDNLLENISEDNLYIMAKKDYEGLDCYENFKSLYGFDIDSFVYLAKSYAKKEDKTKEDETIKVTLDDLAYIYSLIGIETSKEILKDFISFFELLKSKEDGKNKEEDKNSKIKDLITLKDDLKNIELSKEVEILINMLKDSNSKLKDKRIFTYKKDSAHPVIEVDDSFMKKYIEKLDKKYMFKELKELLGDDEELKKAYKGIIENKYKEDKETKKQSEGTKADIESKKDSFIKRYFKTYSKDKEKVKDEEKFVSEYYDNYYDVLVSLEEGELNEGLKSIRKKHQENIQKNGKREMLLLMAKGIAIKEESEKIELEHIKDALGYLYFSKELENEDIKRVVKILMPEEKKEGEIYNELIEKAINSEKKAFSESVKVFNELFKRYTTNSDEIIFTDEKNDEKVEKDDKYYEILYEFADELYYEDEYKTAYEYYKKYYDEKKEYKVLRDMVSCKDKMEEYDDIIEIYTDSKIEEKLDSSEIKQKDLKENSDKRLLLTIASTAAKAYNRKTNKEKAIKIWNKCIDISKDSIEDEEEFSSYAYEIPKVVLTCKEIETKDECIKDLQDKHLKYMETILKKTDHEKYCEKINELYEDYKESDNSKVKDLGEVFKRYFIDLCEKSTWIEEGSYKILLYLAKFEAIKEESKKITKQHLEKAVENIKLTKYALDIFDIKQQNDLKSKIEEDNLSRAIIAQKISYDDEMKAIIKKMKKDEKYFEATA